MQLRNLLKSFVNCRVNFLKNILALSWVSPSFLSLYLGFNPLFNKEKNRLKFWDQVEDKIPEVRSLDSTLKNRIYYYVFANRLTILWFATLRNQALSVKEKEIGLWLGIATPLCDFLIEEHQFTYDQLKDILDGKTDHPYAKIGNQVYMQARSNIQDKARFDSYLDQILFAQSQSINLQNPNVSKPILEKNLREVGGKAMLVYRAGLDHPLLVNEEMAIYQLGSCMQLHNEVFDMYKDLHQGMASVPLSYKNMNTLQERYVQDINEMISAFQRLGYGSFAKRKFLMLALLALSTGMICINQYLALEKQDPGDFDPLKYSREELVCDMDHPLKILQNLYLTLKWKW